MKFLLLVLMSMLTATAGAQDLILLREGDIGGWEYQRFDDIGETEYVQRERALRAVSNASAAGWTRGVAVDLAATPYLHFRWRVDEVGSAMRGADETQKSGDDFAVRLYFVSDSGVQYKTLNLVLSQTQAAGSTWQSPYATWLSKINLYAFARYDESMAGQWQSTTINLAQLWQQHYGSTPITHIGIMTDSDNTKSNATAAYRSIILTAHP